MEAAYEDERQLCARIEDDAVVQDERRKVSDLTRALCLRTAGSGCYYRARERKACSCTHVVPRYVDQVMHLLQVFAKHVDDVSGTGAMHQAA